jgi:hypothetical protein
MDKVKLRSGEGSRIMGFGPLTLVEPKLPQSLEFLVICPQRQAPERFGDFATGHPA